jgi:methyl-accepting chemotaxis protein
MGAGVEEFGEKAKTNLEKVAEAAIRTEEEIRQARKDGLPDLLKTYEEEADARSNALKKQLLMVELNVAKEIISAEDGAKKKLEIEKEFHEEILKNRKAQLKEYRDLYAEDIAEYKVRADQMNEIERERIEAAIAAIRKLENEVAATENTLLEGTVNAAKKLADETNKAADALEDAGTAGADMGDQISDSAKEAADSVSDITREVKNMTSATGQALTNVKINFISDGEPISKKFEYMWQQIKGLSKAAKIKIITEIDKSEALKGLEIQLNEYRRMLNESHHSQLKQFAQSMIHYTTGQMRNLIENIANEAKRAEESVKFAATFASEKVAEAVNTAAEAVNNAAAAVSGFTNQVTQQSSLAPASGGVQIGGTSRGKTVANFNFKAGGETIGPFAGDQGLITQLADALRREGLVLGT